MKFKKWVFQGCFILTLFSCGEKKKIEHYKNGSIKEITYLDQQNNKRKSYEFSSNGNLIAIKNYDNYKLNGNYYWFHENGKLKSISRFKNDRVVDTAFYFDTKCRFISKSVFDKQGQRLKDFFYYISGKLESERAYFAGEGQICAHRDFFESGDLNEIKSSFVSLKKLNNNSIQIMPYNLHEYDTIFVEVIKSFDYKFDFDAEVIRNEKYLDPKQIIFGITPDDFKNGKLNLRVRTKKWKKNKLKRIWGYDIQLNKGRPFPKNNIEAIYRKY